MRQNECLRRILVCFDLNRIHDSVGKALRKAKQDIFRVCFDVMYSGEYTSTRVTRQAEKFA
jgi:hypothetical protein